MDNLPIYVSHIWTEYLNERRRLSLGEPLYQMSSDCLRPYQIKDIEVPSPVDGKRRLAKSQDTKSLASARYLLFPSKSDGTCFSLDKTEKSTCFIVKLAS